MRRAISGVSAALPCKRSESVARRTCKISAAFDTVRPRASMTSVRISSPGWGGFFMGISVFSVTLFLRLFGHIVGPSPGTVQYTQDPNGIARDAIGDDIGCAAD